MNRLTKRQGKHAITIGARTIRDTNKDWEIWDRLAYYEDIFYRFDNAVNELIKQQNNKENENGN